MRCHPTSAMLDTCHARSSSMLLSRPAVKLREPGTSRQRSWKVSPSSARRTRAVQSRRLGTSNVAADPLLAGHLGRIRSTETSSTPLRITAAADGRDSLALPGPAASEASEVHQQRHVAASEAAENHQSRHAASGPAAEDTSIALEAVTSSTLLEQESLGGEEAETAVLENVKSALSIVEEPEQWHRQGPVGRHRACEPTIPSGNTYSTENDMDLLSDGDGRRQGAGIRDTGLGFTRRNELLVGRVAMLGFVASLFGEAVTGKGILAQLNMETGIPIYEAEPLLLFFILFTLIGAVRGLDNKGAADFKNDSDQSQLWPKPNKKSFRGFLGLPETGPLFAFSKPNEIFVGRVAQLGIAFSLIGETVTGKGALAQVRFETGIPVSEMEPLLILSIAFFFLSTIDPETGSFYRDDSGDKED